MVIDTGYVVAQANTGAGYSSPLAQFPTLEAAADWLISIYTRAGDSEPLSQYDPALYVVEEWSDGSPTSDKWQVETDGSTTAL